MYTKNRHCESNHSGREKLNFNNEGKDRGFISLLFTGREQSEPPPPLPTLLFFQKVSCRERVKPWIFASFIIIMSHIFSENFT